jgi:putative toxin-antitoxin system antitoxin component (TIGR02293 family)
MTALKKISRQYKSNANMDLWILREANAGVGADVFFDLVDASGIDRNFLAEEIFDISLKTLMRYRKEGKSLKPREGEVALKMACILEKGIQVFGTMGSFKSWMEKPAYGLGGAKPLHMMNTVTGMDLVEDELLRIEFGALA